MVLISSRLGLDPAAAPCSTSEWLHTYAAPLLPKVRGQFAEFLSKGSLVHLSLLNQPTWVGLRYGQDDLSLAVFLASMGSIASAAPLRGHLFIASRSTPRGTSHPKLPTSLNGARLAARPTLLGSASVVTMSLGTGLSTRCPSASAHAYALGPTNPPRIIRAAEPSGFRWGGFAPPLVVTHPGIRTRGTSTGASAPASMMPRRSPTTRARRRSSHPQRRC